MHSLGFKGVRARGGRETGGVKRNRSFVCVKKKDGWHLVSPDEDFEYKWGWFKRGECCAVPNGRFSTKGLVQGGVFFFGRGTARPSEKIIPTGFAPHRENRAGNIGERFTGHVNGCAPY